MFRISVLHGPIVLAVLAVGAGCSENELALGPVANAAASNSMRVELFGESALEVGDADDPGGADADSSGSGWGTLKGRLRLNGSPPSLPALNASKDTAVCAPGGDQPSDDSFVCEGENGGIANIAIFLRDAPRVHESAKGGGEPVVFDQKNCIFLTHVAPIVVGETLLIKNSDPVGHNTNIAVRKGASFNAIIPANNPGMEYVPTSEEPIPAPVLCNIHPWMKAYLLPRENGYMAVTAPDGAFEIANVPAGVELEFQVWHERAATATGGLVADSDAAKALNWSNRGRFTVTLDDGETREIDVAVPLSSFQF